MPAVGAGNIETPGVRDIYTFTATAGQAVFFGVESQSGLGSLNWKAVDEGGTVIFDTCLGCTEVGSRTLERGGTYTITVGERTNDRVGTYSFRIDPQP